MLTLPPHPHAAGSVFRPSRSANTCFYSWIPESVGLINGELVWRAPAVLAFSILLYPTLGWLFGSYVVLRWRRLTLLVLLQRLLITASPLSSFWLLLVGL